MGSLVGVHVVASGIAYTRFWGRRRQSASLKASAARIRDCRLSGVWESQHLKEFKVELETAQLRSEPLDSDVLDLLPHVLLRLLRLVVHVHGLVHGHVPFASRIVFFSYCDMIKTIESFPLID